MALLKDQAKTLTAAESLTAGLFQSSIADIAGASQVFKGGYVTYSLQQKAAMLEISEEDLRHYGVVSSFTAEKMAEQARRLVDSDLAISLTGVAGPDELEGQPVGTVFIGLATKKGVVSRQIRIGGRSRADVRYIATLHAFHLVRQALLSDENFV